MSNFRWNPQVLADAAAAAGRGLEAATIFVEGAVKETLSVPAPRVRLVGKNGGTRYVAGFKLNDPARMVTPYIKGAAIANATSFRFPKTMKGGAKRQGPAAPINVQYQTAPAIKGDPPRKLSGKLRMSVTHEMLEPMKLFEGGTAPTKGRVGTNIKSARSLEFGKGGHEFLNRTVNKFGPQIQRIIDDAI